MGDRTTVIFIAGQGRSGTTLLDNIFGQVAGVFSAGEVRLAGRSLDESRPCGCGLPVTNCEVWQKILVDAFGGADDAAQERVLRLFDVRGGSALLPYVPGWDSWVSSHWREAQMTMERLYPAISRCTASDVVVDSSKFPLYGHVLTMVPSLDIMTVHLVRDPRAVAYSWIRQKRRQHRADDALYRMRFGVMQSVGRWRLANSLAERLLAKRPARYLLLRYEDFVADPQGAVSTILGMVGLAGRSLSFLNGSTVQLSENHAISGNPSRFQSGLVRLQVDDEWQTSMSMLQKGIVTALAGKQFRKYGYARRPASA